MDSIWLLGSRGCLFEQEARLQQLVGGERLEEENLWGSHEVGTGVGKAAAGILMKS